MDVVRLVEEIKELVELELQNEDIYMNTTFEEFYNAAVAKARGGSAAQEIVYDGVEMHANKMDIKFPTQVSSTCLWTQDDNYDAYEINKWDDLD